MTVNLTNTQPVSVPNFANLEPWEQGELSDVPSGRYYVYDWDNMGPCYGIEDGFYTDEECAAWFAQIIGSNHFTDQYIIMYTGPEI